MGKRDERYLLTNYVEQDEGFFAIEFQEDKRNEPLKRGHDSYRKVKVLVMAEAPRLKRIPKKEGLTKRWDISK